MKGMYRIIVVMMVVNLMIIPSQGEEAAKSTIQYVTKYINPDIEELEAINRQAQKERDAETQRILDEQKARKEKIILRCDLRNVKKPANPDVFQSAFHFAPIDQFNTGTCWSFSTTSFFESEIYRLTDRKIKLSEMYTAYYEYVEKARHYLQVRGNSFFGEGSEGNAVMLVWDKYGIVPAEAYKGELDADGRFDHSEMAAEMQKYLDYVKLNNFWDEEELVLSSLKLIMDKYMGRPPERFLYKGVEMTPLQFFEDVVNLNLNDYVNIMSTLSQPFYAYGEYEVEANWWNSKDYYNVPLNPFYQIIKYAIQHGYTVKLNGDVREPGFNGEEDAAIIPDFDIPRKYIDQDAREFRFNNRSTSDDHDIHLVGYTRQGNNDWFLIKDSSDETPGKFHGYMFYREDYIKLKMLTYIVHKDSLKTIGENFQ
jgi:bleomycin hydrolase